METRILKKTQLTEAAEILKKGETLAFPTETVYGLGANAFDSNAVKKIYAAKGRPTDNPMIVHIANEKDLDAIAEKIPAKAKTLMKKFWPGPLTLILKKKKSIPDEVTAGLKTVAVRMPKNKVAQMLIRECGFPIAAPSANKSGKPSPTTAKHVLDDLNGKIPAIIDGGDTAYGLESTVIDLTTRTPTILRPGAVTRTQITREIGEVKNPHCKTGKKPRSPGMKYRHYAPNAAVYLAEPKKIEEEMKKHDPKKTGLLAKAKVGKPGAFINIGKTKAEIAKNLYRNLRLLDGKKIDVIIVEKTDEDGVGAAIMDRLKKAAKKNNDPQNNANTKNIR